MSEVRTWRVDASAEGCSGMFWRTKPDMGATSSDSSWPRNGTLVKGTSLVRLSFLQITSGSSFSSFFVLLLLSFLNILGSSLNCYECTAMPVGSLDAAHPGWVHFENGYWLPLEQKGFRVVHEA